MSFFRRGRKKRRGSILLLSIFFLIVLFSLSVAFFRIIPAEYHSAAASRNRIQANYASDSGGHHAVNWIKYRMLKNGSSVISEAEIANYNNNNFGSHSTDFDAQDWPTLSSTDAKLVAHKLDDNWSFLSRIRLDDTDFFRRIYTIESCAYLRGKPQRVVKMTVQNESFAKYALYISDWKTNNIYSMGPNGIQGPVHTNDYLRVAAVGGSSFWNATKADGSPQDPWVSGPLARITQASTFKADSTSPKNTLGIDGDGIQYANGNSYAADPNYVPYDGTGNPLPERYEKIVTNGRDNIKQIGVVPLPEQNTDLREKAWGGTVPSKSSDLNAALNGDPGFMTVMTDTGKVNDPNGKVTGGIFIDNKDVQDFLLDITPEGHQKIRIRQGKTTVNVPGSVTYKDDVPYYKKKVIVPATTKQECDKWNYVTKTKYKKVWYTRTVTKTNGPICGYKEIFIDGDQGVSTPVQVPKECTYDEDYFEYEEDGTYQEKTDCAVYKTVDVPESSYWKYNVPKSDPDAVFWKTKYEVVDINEYPDADVIPSTRKVDNWNSVVEVNDTDYKIPFHDGVTVNGEVIPDKDDPRLIVGDGHTVKIANDYSDSKGEYAEYTVMEGRINGVVFSDQNIWNARGTNKGSKYDDGSGTPEYHGRVIATNVADKKDIEIQDSILQYYDGSDVDADGNPLNDGKNRLAVGNTSPNGDHILGLIAEDIWVDASGNKPKDRENTDTWTREKGFNGGYFKGGINVYAIMMAGRMKGNTEIGGFGVRDDNMDKSSKGMGDFNLYGGLIAAISRDTQDSELGAGYRLSLNYDVVAAEQMQNFSSTNIFVPLRYVTYNPAPK